MPLFSLYDLDTGEFTGARQRCPAGQHDQAFGAIEGEYSRATHRVDLEGGEIVARGAEDPPPADPAKAWAWNGDAWTAGPSVEALANGARAKRDKLLAACDWVRLRADDQGVALPAEWLAYRQALRDITEQAGFPTLIDWPTPPT